MGARRRRDARLLGHAKHAVDGMLKFYNWMLETSKGALDTRSLVHDCHEFDWSKVNNVIYDQRTTW